MNGKRLLSENPLHGLDWPKEKNPRRPVASHQRYLATVQHADAVDPTGRLRCILALARYAGRRESARRRAALPGAAGRAAADQPGPGGEMAGEAEKLAEQPKLAHGVFHPYRRLWATERKGLADADVAAAGGWRDTRALKMSYQQPDPATVLSVVEHTA